MTGRRAFPAWWSVAAVVFLALLVLFSFGPERTQTAYLFSVYGILFILYVFLVRNMPDSIGENTGRILLIALAARLAVYFAWPGLSDDIWRFLWDGRLLANGFHPYDFTPAQFLAIQTAHPGPSAEWQTLFDRLNSPDYYTIYPPLSQAVFGLAAWIFPGDHYGTMLTIRTVILLAEVGTVVLLIRLARRFALPGSTVLWYALNPLVILEFTGNLHFEALMIFFLLLSVDLAARSRIILSGLSFAGAVLVKLHPAMLLPFFLKFLWTSKGRRPAGTLLLAAGFGSFIPFFAFFLPAEELMIRLGNLSESVGLYYGSFEFNAGIYYLIRWIGTVVQGYNPIAVTGPLMFALTAAVLLYLLLRMPSGLRPFSRTIYLVYLAYILFATTVHPWYILPLLPFALLTGYRLPVLWTAVIFLSYFAYGQPEWRENPVLLAIEYTCIFVFAFYEFRIRGHRGHPHERLA